MGKRGYFGIGVYHIKSEVNIGTLWRGAFQLGASYIFTVGRRYSHQCSDTTKAWKHIPLLNYDDMDAMMANHAYSCPIVAIEEGTPHDRGTPLPRFCHFERCVYLLGAEDRGLPKEVIDRCHALISIPSVRLASYNVAMAGTLVMYDRAVKRGVFDK